MCIRDRVCHGDIRLTEHGGDRRQQARRVSRKPGLEDTLEVDVSAKGEDDRISAPERPSHRRRRSRRRRLALVPAEDGDERHDCREKDADEYQKLAGKSHEKGELERDRMCRHDSSPLE